MLWYLCCYVVAVTLCQKHVCLLDVDMHVNFYIYSQNRSKPTWVWGKNVCFLAHNANCDVTTDCCASWDVGIYFNVSGNMLHPYRHFKSENSF